MLRTSMIVLLMAACGGKKQDAPEREPAPAVRAEVDAGAPGAVDSPALPPALPSTPLPTPPPTSTSSSTTGPPASDPRAELARLDRRLDELAQRVEDAVRAVAGAKTIEEREAAKTTFEALRREKAELDAEIAAARASHAP